MIMIKLKQLTEQLRSCQSEIYECSLNVSSVNVGAKYRGGMLLQADSSVDMNHYNGDCSFGVVGQNVTNNLPDAVQ